MQVDMKKLEEGMMPKDLADAPASAISYEAFSRRIMEPRLPREDDPVNHPPHYTSHPSGVECITITEWMNFNLGNAVKYIWRADDKGATIEDLKKARWYLDREIARLEKLEKQ